MNRKKNGGVELAPKRREADARPEITFEQTFLIPVSDRNAGAAEFPIYLILAYGEKEMGVLFHEPVTLSPASRGNGSPANREEISRPWSVRTRIILRILSRCRSRRSEGEIEANRKLRSHKY